MHLISNTSSNARMGVDSSTVTPNGRPSVRLTSNKSYSSGLVVIDIDHMPGGVCGTWYVFYVRNGVGIFSNELYRPAFWMVGPNWPYDGEIDIIEGVNDQTQNDMTLHSGPSCSITNNGAFSGSFVSDNCDSSGGTNQGCQIAASNTNTYGTGFNANQGGVYATEWTGSSIQIWFFPRNSIPSDVTSGSPDPSSWGTPLAMFQGGCDIGTSFVSQQLVFDTTFCGDWAGNSWSTSSCASQASTCNDFVQNNPSAFTDAYWSVNALKVYQNSGSGSSPSVVPQTTTTWAQPSSAPVPTTFAVSTTYVAPAPWTSDVTTSNWGWFPQVSGTGVVGEEPGAAPTAATTGGAGVEAAAASSSLPESDFNWAPVATGTGPIGEESEPTETNDPFAPMVARSRHARHLGMHKRHAAGRF